VYDAEDSAMSTLPLLEAFAIDVVPEDDVVALAVVALDAESVFAPLQAASASSSVQSAARLKVPKCMLIFLSVGVSREWHLCRDSRGQQTVGAARRVANPGQKFVTKNFVRDL